MLVLGIKWLIGLGNGYILERPREDYTYISKDEALVIEPTVVDFNKKSQYLYGIGLKVETYICGDNLGYKIIVPPQKFYFIINTHSDIKEIFTEYDEFNKKLTSIELDGAAKLDYSKADLFWKRYKERYNFLNSDGTLDQCYPENGGTHISEYLFQEN